MLGSTPNFYWVYSWKFITPFCTFAVIIVAIVSNSEVTLGDYRYPFYAHIIGWTIVGICMLPIPLCFTLELFKNGFGKVSWKKKNFLLFL